MLLLFLIMNPLAPPISIADLDLFFRVAKLKSFRECARQVNMSPGAVSKSIKRLEQKTGSPLFQRNPLGVFLTLEGTELLSIAEKVLSLTSSFQGKSRPKTKSDKLFSIGALSFLCTKLLPEIIPILATGKALTRFRFCEFSQNDLVAQGLNGAFEIALHLDPLEWTQAWSSHEVGYLRWGAYTRKNHPLHQKTKINETDILAYPFVMPSTWNTEGFLRSEDHCPAPPEIRIRGHEVGTAEAALSIIQLTDQVTFIPSLIARNALAQGWVREVRVMDWPIIEKKLYLSVKEALVPQSLFKLILQALQHQIKIALSY